MQRLIDRLFAFGNRRPLVLAVRAVALLLAVAQFAVLAWVLAQRYDFPLDIEWMESGMMCEILRFREHAPVFAAPSADFIPYPYTPLYALVCAWLSYVAPGGLTYALARVVSIVAFSAATLLGGWFVARRTGSRVAAVAAMAIPAAAFAESGAFYDVVRVDSLLLFFETAAVVVLDAAAHDDGGAPRRGWRAHAGTLAAATLLVAAFFTKQTATVFMLFGGVALLVSNWRLVPTFVGALCALALPILFGANHATGGWFFRYTSVNYGSVPFDAFRGFVQTPMRIVGIVGAGCVLVPAAMLLRRRVRVLWFSAGVAATGIVVSCLGFGLEWAWTNAFIPGVFFLSLATGTAAGVLLRPPSAPERAVPPAFVAALVAISLVATHYQPRAHVPRPEQREAGERLLAMIRSAPGEVFIPFHSFYPHLVGKSVSVHHVTLMENRRGNLPTPAGLAEGLRDGRWSLAILDNRVVDYFALYPGLTTHYVVTGTFDGPRPLTGSYTWPAIVAVPRRGTREERRPE